MFLTFYVGELHKNQNLNGPLQNRDPFLLDLLAKVKCRTGVGKPFCKGQIGNIQTL